MKTLIALVALVVALSVGAQEERVIVKKEAGIVTAATDSKIVVEFVNNDVVEVVAVKPVVVGQAVVALFYEDGKHGIR